MRDPVQIPPGAATHSECLEPHTEGFILDPLYQPEPAANSLAVMPLRVEVRPGRLLQNAPSVHSLGKLNLEISTEGWRFPAPPELAPTPEDGAANAQSQALNPEKTNGRPGAHGTPHSLRPSPCRIRPPDDMAV
ncbi:MAG TPA: hypothetical protein VG099_04425, partial [Gemmataceae bacterium]|nr:hypothetical protein [Gemmataceae bacterium]